MADDQDDSQKTEDPTPRKLEEAKRKGQVATSKEVNNWFMILSAAILVMMFSPIMLPGISNEMKSLIAMPHAYPADLASLGDVLQEKVLGVLGYLLMPMAVMVVGAFLSGVIQNGLMWTPESFMPKLDRISVMSGFKRMFSLRSFIEFLKGVFKICIVGAASVILMWPLLEDVEKFITLDITALLSEIRMLATRLIIGVLSIVTVIAVVDYLYQKFEFLKSLRMSRQDIKDEMKQSDGDPMVKQRLRQLRAEKARQRMMAAVPKADVVITNPTHYSVALKYDIDTMPAPVMIAKGVDNVAMRIRELAKEHKIVIVENPPLCRALYETVELEEQIPPEHYKAVAEVISYVMKVKKKFLS